MRNKLLAIVLACVLATGAGAGNIAYAGTESGAEDTTVSGTDTGLTADTNGSTASSDEVEAMVVDVDSPVELQEAMEETDMVDAAEIVEQGEAEGLEPEEIIDDTYQLKRLLLFSDNAVDTYGASDIIRYEDLDYYVFSFDTEAQTEAAYERMVEDYGEDKCAVDKILIAEDMLASVDDVTPSVSTGWGTSYMGMDYLKAQTDDYNLTGTVKVAVVDSGINSDFDVFEGRILEDSSYNFYDDDDDISDGLGHGTHVSGIIADATPDNVKIMVEKCFSDDGYSTNAGIVAAVQNAIDEDADVINFSICWYGDTADASTFNYIDTQISKATSENIVMCVAAGNTHVGLSGIQNVAHTSYPANKSGVITVSALAKTGSDENVISTKSVKFASAYSYYGSTVDFSAPGSAVKSTWYDGTYKESSGTSMATPYITAAASYVKLVEPTVSNDRLESILKSYCVDLGDEGKDIYYGNGCPYMKTFYDDFFAEGRIADCTLKSVSNTQSGLKLTWNKVNGADGYRIYRRGTTGGYTCIKKLTSGGTLTYTDKTAVSGKKYRYIVKATSNGKLGNYASSIVTYRLAQPKVSAKNTTKGITISWKKVPSAKKYVIYRKAPGQKSWKRYKTVSYKLLSFTDTSVKGAKLYSYTVKAARDSVGSSYSASGKTLCRISTKKIKALTSKARSRLTVKWSTSSAVTGYQIQYSTSKKFKTYKLVTVKGCRKSAKTITKLKSGKYYYVRVRAYKKIGSKTYYSGFSTTKKVKIK